MNIKAWLKNNKIGVLYGGRSAERDISLLSGKAVLKALKDIGCDAVGIDAGTDTPFKLKKNKVDFAYIALHGSYGEDGTIQGMLEVMGIPYSGCGVLSSAVSMDKVYSKRIFDSAGLPTAPWRALYRNESILPSFEFPAVVKPATQGSAIGVSIVSTKKGLRPAVQAAFKYDNCVIIEKYIKGTEITVGVLGGTALPVVEIVPANEFYDFESKYKPGKSEHIIPPRLSSKTIKSVQKLAVETFYSLNCRAVARIDMIVDKNNSPWILEANTIPGMTETSLLPDAARAAGIKFSELVLKIIEYSLK